MAIKDEYQTHEGRISERKEVATGKNFMRDFLMGLFFIVVFTGAFLITWNILGCWISNRGHTIWICIGVAFVSATFITFLTNFTFFKLPNLARKWKKERAQKKRKTLKEK